MASRGSGEERGKMKGIRQLAEHLDISIGTVSRALNGKPDVNEETRKESSKQRNPSAMSPTNRAVR